MENYKIILSEKDIPEAWYNVTPDLPAVSASFSDSSRDKTALKKRRPAGDFPAGLD
jgi:predicted alternative tryptophan synthase beta-subunit